MDPVELLTTISAISDEDVSADIQHLLLSSGVASIRRFHGQPFWDAEAEASDQAMSLERDLRLESVADHSWKVADAALLLADHFPLLDKSRCIALALLHDKLELLTGDWSPIDRDGTGESTHAFNVGMAGLKEEAERVALERLLQSLRPAVREQHRKLYLEVIEKRSDEARFVAAIDKLASLIFVMQKKRSLDPRHLQFTMRYAAKSVTVFPGIAPYYEHLRDMLLSCVSGDVEARDRSQVPASC